MRQVACVSGAQLSSYATFLLHKEQAPLAIVLTALSTVAGVVITPALALLLLGKRLPIDVACMSRSITQVVLVPVTAGAHPGTRVCLDLRAPSHSVQRGCSISSHAMGPSGNCEEG